MHLHIIARQAAKSAGLKFYFTGKPCKRGMCFERRVSNTRCTCPECAAAYLASDTRSTERSRLWRAANPEWQREHEQRWRDRNRDKERGRLREFHQEHPEKQADYYHRSYQKNADTILRKKRDYYRNNPDKSRVYVARRRAIRLNAIPAWSGEFDELVMCEAQKLRIQRMAETGISWEVDHLFPLQARRVCGLHVAENIQVIPADLNKWKSNRMVLTQPGEWLKA